MFVYRGEQRETSISYLSKLRSLSFNARGYTRILSQSESSSSLSYFKGDRMGLVYVGLVVFFLFGEDFWSEDKVGNGNCNTFARTQICFDYFLFLHDAITKKRDGHLSSFLLFPLFFKFFFGLPFFIYYFLRTQVQSSCYFTTKRYTPLYTACAPPWGPEFFLRLLAAGAQTCYNSKGPNCLQIRGNENQLPPFVHILTSLYIFFVLLFRNKRDT
jgi:hypothetical protein